MSRTSESITKIDFEILDGLRGVAALYVVINHCRANMMITGSQMSEILPFAEWSFTTKVHYAFLQMTILGKEFVILFFILSGFSIAHSLRTNSSVLQYYKRRLIRLYPPLLLALLWAYFVFILCASDDPIFLLKASVFADLRSILLNLMYIPTGILIPQFWSLTHEVIFYILSPLIFYNKFTSRYFTRITIYLFIGFTFVSPLLPIGDNVLVNFFCDYAVFFSIGIITYEALNSSKIWSWTHNRFVFIATILILFPSMVVLKFFLGLHNKPSLIVASVFSILLILNFLHYRIKNKLLDFLGKMSYTLYITHFASIYLILLIMSKAQLIERDVIPNMWFLWPIGVIGCILLAIPFYYLAEKPSKMILSNLRRKSSGR